MKSTRPSKNSFRKLLIRKEGVEEINKNLRMGETSIPLGDEEAQIILPQKENTCSYSVLKTDGLNAALRITNGSTDGLMKGLVLATDDTPRIEAIEISTREIEITSDLYDGSLANFLSDGRDWFCWGMFGGTGDVIGQRGTVNLPPNHPADRNENTVLDGQEPAAQEWLDQNAADPQNPTPEELQNAIDSVANEEEQARGGSSETPAPVVPQPIGIGEVLADQQEGASQVTFGGDATPGSIIEVSLDGSPVDTVIVGSDGSWSWSTEYVADGSYDYTFSSSEDVDDVAVTTDIQPAQIFVWVVDSSPVVIERTTDNATAEAQILSSVSVVDALDSEASFTITVDTLGYNDALVHNATFVTDLSIAGSSYNLDGIVKDTVVPVITLLGDNPLDVSIGSPGADPGATLDESGTIVSDWSTVTAGISAEGTYTVTYTATDDAGNAAAPVTRTLNAIAASIDVGLIISDDLFNSPELTVHGTAPIVDGSNNQLYSFAGNGSFAFNSGLKYDSYDFSAIPVTGSYAYNGSARTYSLWFNSSDVNTKSTLISKYGRFGASNTSKGWFVELENGIIKSTIDTNDAVGTLSGPDVTFGDPLDGETAIQASTWYHLVNVYDSGTCKIYLNGVLVKEDPIATPDQQTAEYTPINLSEDSINGLTGDNIYRSRFRIGSKMVNPVGQVQGDFFNGSIAYPEVYYSELTLSQIQLIYNSQNGTL